MLSQVGYRHGELPCVSWTCQHRSRVAVREVAELSSSLLINVSKCSGGLATRNLKTESDAKRKNVGFNNTEPQVGANFSDDWRSLAHPFPEQPPALGLLGVEGLRPDTPLDTCHTPAGGVSDWTSSNPNIMFRVLPHMNIFCEAIISNKNKDDGKQLGAASATFYHL